MKIVALGRQEGKTTLCVDYMKQNPKVHMLVWHDVSVERITSDNPELQGRVHKFSDDIKRITEDGEVDAYIIDAIDECLHEMTGGKTVRLVTLTQDDKDTYL